jgi:prostaglandin-endoperoxide synthase 2
MHKFPFSRTRTRLLGVALVTIVEGSGVYAWLRIDDPGPPGWGFVALFFGELLETTIVAIPIARARARSPIPVGDPYGTREHRRRFDRRFSFASVAELAIWYAWLQLTDVSQWLAAAVLLVLMHLKHQLEATTVRDLSYFSEFWAGTIASASEAAGAAACLALILDGEPWLAAAALALGFLIEHRLLMYRLYHALEERDIFVPRPRRPPATVRGRLAELVGKRLRWPSRVVQSIGPLERGLNRLAINRLVETVEPRPNPLSTMAPYTSWSSLTDRTYSGRHLPPAAAGARGFPPVDEVAALFRRDGAMQPCEKSSVLFPSFAQWFVDGFLRTQRKTKDHPRNTLRNESNHDIDLCPLYGLNDEWNVALRAKSDGLLRSQTINGEEFPEYLCNRRGRRKPEFAALPVPIGFDAMTRAQKRTLFAMGTDVHSLGFTAFNVLFLREHNSIAKQLRTEHVDWDDDQLFKTARNIVIVLVIKIVIEDYINHITGYWFRLRLPGPATFRKAPWFRQNWMAVEFNLLYRWHALMPAALQVRDRNLTVEQMLTANDVLTDLGLRAFMLAASAARAGRIGLFNTDPYLVTNAEVPSITQGRQAQLRSYNDYRELCHLPRLQHFGQFSTEPEVGKRLHALYDHVNDVEFYPGLFAEEVGRHEMLPPLMTAMVAFDAFSQVITNPLLGPRVYNSDTFTDLGLRIIDDTNRLEDVIRRNLPHSLDEDYFSLTWREYHGP